MVIKPTAWRAGETQRCEKLQTLTLKSAESNQNSIYTIASPFTLVSLVLNQILMSVPDDHNLPLVFDFSDSKIADLSTVLPESFLPIVRDLILDNNFIVNLSPLRKVLPGSSLIELSLSGNRVVNLSPLRSCLPGTLRFLNLSGNRIKNLSPLKNNLPASLMVLKLSDNRIVDLSPLKGSLPPSLHTLYFCGNLIVDLSPLQGSLPDTLDCFSLDNNPIENFSPFKNALPKSLRQLYLGRSRVKPLDDESWVNLYASIGCNDLNEDFELLWGGDDDADWDEIEAVRETFTLFYTQVRVFLLFLSTREVPRFGTRSHVKRLPVDLIREMRDFVT
jgi:Leucine-rich repeat (LRR) protein